MRNLLRKPLMLIALVALLTVTISGSALAGKDMKKSDQYAKHDKLGINVATAVTKIVKSLELTIDVQFIKKPKASDYFTKVKDNASYADSFIIAHYNNLDIPKNINPAAKVSREQFAHWLFQALSQKGDYMWIEIYLNIADEKQINGSYMNSIQKLLIANITSLDSKQKFYPNRSVSLQEAKTLINRTLNYIKNNKPNIPEPSVLSNVQLAAESYSDKVTAVTLSALIPHPGYGFEITNIQFVKGEAIISYRAVLPDPDRMYPQVITDIRTVTYIPSNYKPVLGAEQPTVPYPG